MKTGVTQLWPIKNIAFFPKNLVWNEILRLITKTQAELTKTCCAPQFVTYAIAISTSTVTSCCLHKKKSFHRPKICAGPITTKLLLKIICFESFLHHYDVERTAAVDIFNNIVKEFPSTRATRRFFIHEGCTRVSGEKYTGQRAVDRWKLIS